MVGEVRSDEGREASIRNDEVLRIVLVGKTGSGKSATGNSILGPGAFKSDFSLVSVTSICEEASGDVAFRKVSLVDTPGLFDTRYSEDKTLKKISDCLRLAAPGPHGFLLVIKLDRFTDEEQRSVEMIQKVFGQKSDEYTMILFTNGDQVEGKSVEEMLIDCPKLQELVRACKDRYHVFNNKTEDPSQVNELLEKITKMVIYNGGSHYTSEMFQEAARKIEEEKERERREKEEKRRAQKEELKEQLKQEIREKEREKARGSAFSALMKFGGGIGIAIGAYVTPGIGAALATTASASELGVGVTFVANALMTPIGTVVGACGGAGAGLGIALLIGGGQYLYRLYNTAEKKKPLINDEQSTSE